MVALDQVPVGSDDFYIFLSVSIVLVILAGIFSGLTLGLLSLDKLDLEILTKSGTDHEKTCANRILPLVRRHHLLLVTLLLAQAAVTETLPIFLDDLVPIPIAIAISVTAVLLFGEVIPQAICARHGLTIGAYLAWLVWIVVGICFIIAYPISLILDWILGHEEPAFYRRAQLRELVKIHEYQALDGQEPQGTLTQEEVNIIQGAIDLKDKTVKDRITPLNQVYMLNLNDKLDITTMEEIISKGFSRIPVCFNQRDNIIGMLLVKRLISLDPADEVPINSLDLYPILRVTTEMPLYDVLNSFQKGKSHMGIVVDPIDHITVIGIITLEDVIEELIQVDLTDESDVRGTGMTYDEPEVKNDDDKNNKNNNDNINNNNNNNNININTPINGVTASTTTTTASGTPTARRAYPPVAAASPTARRLYPPITAPSPIPPRVRQFVRNASIGDFTVHIQ